MDQPADRARPARPFAYTAAAALEGIPDGRIRALFVHDPAPAWDRGHGFGLGASADRRDTRLAAAPRGEPGGVARDDDFFLLFMGNYGVLGAGRCRRDQQ